MMLVVMWSRAHTSGGALVRRWRLRHKLARRADWCIRRVIQRSAAEGPLGSVSPVLLLLLLLQGALEVLEVTLVLLLLLDQLRAAPPLQHQPTTIATTRPRRCRRGCLRAVDGAATAAASSHGLLRRCVPRPR